MSKQKSLTPWMMQDVTRINSKPNLQRLTDSQRQALASIMQFPVLEAEWDRIEQCRQDFCWSCWAEPQAIEYLPFNRRLKMLASAMDAALTAFSGRLPSRDKRHTTVSMDKTTLAMALELWPDGSAPSFLFDAICMMQVLGSNARHAIKRTADLPEKNPWRLNWIAFVDALASIFEAHGHVPTAAGRSNARNPRLSVFVAFVEGVVDSLPEDFRRHKQSREAMSKAVARALKFRRSRKGLSAA
jgi:hypothetical protein